MSAKRAAGAPERDAAREALIARDGPRCRLWRGEHGGSCFGRPTTPHHLRKQGQGGPWDLANLVVLCAHHNEWVERARPLAWSLGLVVNRGDDPLDCWTRLRAAGLGLPNDPESTKER